jgi:(E)-4-hydroxy-3-methylbut-2-enyl-diphosphate synthase
MRRISKCIMLGKVPVGGNSPVTVQSMTNTRTSDISATIAQVDSLRKAGCDIVRVAVPDIKSADALKQITAAAGIPVVADIHFDYRIALRALDNGIAGLRINPGNIGSIDRIEQVVSKAKERSVPIRIGVNGGSVERDILGKHGGPCAEALVESALRHVDILEKMGFYSIKISLKASDVLTTIRAYKEIADKVDYPLHLGVTEAGTFTGGTVKSAIGIGSLLLDGIGDTIRVSLTEDPVTEVEVGREILSAIGLRNYGVQVISCPTCGRCEIDLIGLAKQVTRAVKGIDKPIKVAVMGCAVNGPGEAREADIGVAGGKGKGIIFKKGKIIKTVNEPELLDTLLQEIGDC